MATPQKSPSSRPALLPAFFFSLSRLLGSPYLAASSESVQLVQLDVGLTLWILLYSGIGGELGNCPALSRSNPCTDSTIVTPSGITSLTVDHRSIPYTGHPLLLQWNCPLSDPGSPPIYTTLAQSQSIHDSRAVPILAATQRQKSPHIVDILKTSK